MIEKVALCADEESLRMPEIIGLGGENLDAQEWLRTYSSGVRARAELRGDRGVEEVWVASCDDVEPINLAAALKSERPALRVCLCSDELSGSLRSRAHAASLDMLLDTALFARRYARAKRTCGETEAGLPTEPQGTVGPKGDLQADRSAEAQLEDAAETSGALSEAAVETPPPAPERAADEPDRLASASLASRASGAERTETVSAGVGLVSPKAPPRKGFVLPVVSGSGGSGKSTVAALAALYAQQCGYSTVAIDLDLQFGDLKELLGVKEALSVDQLVESPGLARSLAARNGRPAIVAAPSRLEQSEQLAPRVSALVDALAAQFDVVVANTGSSWGEQHAVLLERAASPLFLIDQSASSLRACRHAVELCGRCGIATSPFVFAVNRCSKIAPITPMDASCALQGAKTAELADGGRDVEDFMGAGCVADLLESDNALAVSAKALLASILPDFEERAGAPASGKSGRKQARRAAKARARRRRAAS